MGEGGACRRMEATEGVEAVSKFKPGDVVKTLAEGERYWMTVITPKDSLGIVTRSIKSYDDKPSCYVDFDHVYVIIRQVHLISATPAEAAAFRERGSFALNGHVERRAYTLLNMYYDYGYPGGSEERPETHVTLAREMGQPTWKYANDMLNAGKPNPEYFDWSASNRAAMVEHAATQKQTEPLR